MSEKTEITVNMKTSVVDTSVVIKWFFEEKGSKEAQKLKEDHLNGKLKLCTLDLLLYEFASAFKNYKSKKIEEKDFRIAITTLQSLALSSYSLGFHELSYLFNLSRKLNISIYDCSYILLSKKLHCPLYTADQKLHSAAKKVVTSYLI